MGQIHLLFPDHFPVDQSLAASVHVIGLDGIPGPCRINRMGQVLTIARNRDESGHVFLAWPTGEWGDLVLSTSTLPESDDPWRVAVEVARGTSHRLRNQLSAWEEGGLEIPGELREAATQAAVMLAAAVLEPDAGRANLAARRSTEISVKTIFRLCRIFGDQIARLRIGNVNLARFWMGCMVRPEDPAVPAAWKQLDLAEQEDLNPVGQGIPDAAARGLALGPLVDAAPNGFDAKLQGLNGFDARRDLILQRARTRLAGLTPALKFIHAVAGLNGTGHRGLSYPQQLQLTLDVLQVVEDHGQRCPAMVSFDNPWGERLARSVGGTHPLQIADSLLRRGTRISLLGLEINLDYHLCGSVARDPLQWLDMLDLWSQLGLPLVVLLRVPGQLPSGNEAVRPNMHDEHRLDLIRTVLPMLIARPIVQGILWQELVDHEESMFPGAGLFDRGGRPKPLWHAVRETLEGLELNGPAN